MSLLATTLSIFLATDDLATILVPIESSTVISGEASAAILKAVGKSRLVMLGEQTHGDGTSFELKVALVKLLHEKAGFDVLIWESGYYDCAKMNAEIPGQMPMAKVARMGVFGHWATAAEAFPIFDYARSSYAGKHPLQMAGFDLQASGSASGSQFTDMLSWFDGRPELTASARTKIDQAFAIAKGAESDPTKWQIVQAALTSTAGIFRAAYDASPRALDRHWGPHADFRRKTLELAANYEKMLLMNQEFQSGKRPFWDSYNLREKVNAETVSYLMNHQFRGKRAILWAHNSHIFKGQPTRAAGAELAAPTDDIDSMGRMVGKSFGNSVYSIGIFAQTGSWSWMGGPPIEFKAPSATSLESQLSATGRALGFMDWRNLPPGHALRQPLEANSNRQNGEPFTTVWPNAFDGILFIKAMKPRTQMPR